MDDYIENDRFALEIAGFTKYYRDVDGEHLSGHGKVVWKKIEIKMGNESIFIGEMDIEIYAKADFVDKPKCKGHIHVMIKEGLNYANISLFMSSVQFSALRDTPQQSEPLVPLIQLWFDIPESRSFNENEYHCKVANFEFNILEYRSASLPLNYNEISRILKPWVPASIESDVGKIGAELVKSLYIWLEKNPKIKVRNSYFDEYDDTYEYEQYLRSIGELIDQLRDSRYDSLSQKQIDDMEDIKLDYWEYAGLSTEAFLKKTEDLSNKERQELRRRYARYDSVWSGYRPSISELISTGKIVKNEYQQTHLDYQCLLNTELEEVAKMYTVNTWMQSPTLEWLLVDALLFNEAGAFACLVKNMPDVISDAAPSSVPSFKESLTLKVLNLLWETGALALTALLSDFIDVTHGATFWGIFATITLGRWLNKNHLNPIDDQSSKWFKNEEAKENIKSYLRVNEKIKQLSSDMIRVSDRSQDIDVFNARLVREMLYDLEKRGAVYKQAVFNILDKRIARE
ncbi:MAG: hypothetical protein WCL60_10620 [Methylococcales bacterium]